MLVGLLSTLTASTVSQKLALSGLAKRVQTVLSPHPGAQGVRKCEPTPEGYNHAIPSVLLRTDWLGRRRQACSDSSWALVGSTQKPGAPYGHWSKSRTPVLLKWTKMGGAPISDHLQPRLYITATGKPDFGQRLALEPRKRGTMILGNLYASMASPDVIKRPASASSCLARINAQ